ncbi:membrane protein [Spirochaetia bacterium]|nr:membrane protein [Spirochaetia bacterium]
MEKLFKYPKLLVAIIAAITVFFALQLFRIELDNNNFRFVPEHDTARLTSAQIDDTFGSSLFILVGLERKYATVFDAVFLQRMQEYVKRIEEIEVAGTINSIISTDYITSSGDTIVVEKLVKEDFTGTPEEITELKRRILSWNLYKNALISDDFTATQIMIPLNISSEDAGGTVALSAYREIRSVAKEMFNGIAEVYVAGLPVLSGTVNEAITNDLILLVPLVVIVVLAVLFFSFRNITALTLPLLTVVIAVVWSIGAMPIFGIKLSVLSMVLPVILVAVGSAYGIHVVTHYIVDTYMYDTMDSGTHRELIFALLRKIGKPVFLAALTTFVGFFSLCFTSVPPIREFGIFASFGVLVSFGVALTLIPALLLIRGPKKIQEIRLKKSDTDSGKDLFNTGITNGFLSVVQKKGLILTLFVVIVLISGYGLSKVIVDNIIVEYFKSTTDVAKSDRFIREKFGGSKIVSVVLQGSSPEATLHPESLNALDGLGVYLESNVPEVGKIMGFTDLIKRINQVFNANENPDGWKNQESGNTGEDAFGFSDFGFGDSGGDSFEFNDSNDTFGFGDFGFDNFSGDSVSDYNDSVNLDSGNEISGKTYTIGELVSLFDKAGSANGVMNANELIWELKKQINYEGASYYEIPTIPERYAKKTPEELQRLISNYLVLLSGNISDYANDPLEPTAIKTTVQLRTIGQMDTNVAIREIYNYINANFPKNVEITVGGTALVEESLNQLVVQSQVSSVFISLLVVLIIISASNKSIVAGLIGIVPLSISILINFAVMGFLGIKLNIGTAMVASVSVGIGIDYTIHFIDAFKREYAAARGKEGFLRKTFETSGKAILINAVSVGAGFAVLLLSQFVMIGNLGLLIALTMATSALVSMTVIPILLMLVKPKFIYKEF